MPEGSGNSDKEPDYKKLHVIVSIVGGVISVLVGIYSLTGFNLLKEMFSDSHSNSSGSGSSSTTTTEPTEPTWTNSAEESTEISTSTTTETTTTTEETTESSQPSAPSFSVRSEQWNGPCGYSWCTMSAVFRNNGGPGNGSATFYVLLPDVNQYLAKCSAVLPTTDEDEVTSAGCTASSAQLQQYFRTHPGGTVRMDVKVDG